MIYSFTERDIDDLGVGDVIIFERLNGTNATITITEVEKSGQDFIGVTEYQTAPNEPITIANNDTISRPFLLKLKNEQRVLDFKKAKTIPNNQVSKPSSMQEIRVDEIIGRLGWSSGLKISMIADFDKSGYQTFRDLVEDHFSDTSIRIQQEIEGFSSGKNTYLQANEIAKELFKYAQSNGIPNKAPTTTLLGWKILTTLPKSGIIVYKSILGVSEKILLDPTYLDDKGGILQIELTKYLLYSSIIEEYEESQESFLWNFNGSMSPKSLREFYDGLDDILVKYIINTSSQTSVSSQPNLEEPINGIIIKGTYSGELVRIIKPYSGDDKEKYYEYECSLQGKTSILPRNNFMVVGDIIEITFGGGSYGEAKILVIQNDTTIKIDSKKYGVENWNIGGFDWDNDSIKIVEYYNIHEIFDSKNPILNQPPLPPTKINQYEAELNQAKKDVAQLMFLRSIVSPIDFEQKIEIGQLLSEKQKGVNELNFKIVEKKLSSGNIFDDLFEQSFTQIKNVYDDVYVSPNEPVDFFAPNGDRSKLSDALNQIIRTPQFMEWFGNWELAYLYKDTDDFDYKCSQVLSQSGEPLLVWHGTGQAFSYFKFDTFPAAYFAVNRDYSQWFAELHGGGQGYTIPFFLNVRNPLDLTYFQLKKVTSNDFFAFLYLKTGMDMDELEVNPIFKDPNFPPNETWVYLRNNPKMLKKIADMNLYDGIHFYETNPGVPPNESAHSTEVYITFTPHQAKISDPNRGLMLLSSLKSFLLEKGGKI
jgi:hypothetical protein